MRSTLTRSDSRLAAICAAAGTVLLLVGTLLHPMQADPNDALAAFTEYAADHLWVASHLTQLAGIALIVAALLVLARELERSARTSWARIAAGGAVATLAMATVLQAVDGIALKFMVDTWAAAAPLHKETLFYAAFAVRQVEIGLASLLSVLFGLTVIVYGAALWADATYPRWLGALAFIGGVPTALSGLLMAYTAFSEMAMMFNMAGNSVLLLWMLGVAHRMWRDGKSAMHADAH